MYAGFEALRLVTTAPIAKCLNILSSKHRVLEKSAAEVVACKYAGPAGVLGSRLPKNFN